MGERTLGFSSLYVNYVVECDSRPSLLLSVEAAFSFIFSRCWLELGSTSMSLHVAGLILARGGSRGIPLKNLAPLGERPLLEWALRAMLNFGGFDSLWVSTDHPGIATCASALGAMVFARSAEFAGDEAASLDAVQEFLRLHPEVDVVALVQCTSPFIRPGIVNRDDSPEHRLLRKVELISELLAEAHRLVTEEDYDSVFSVSRQKRLRWSEISLSQEKTRPLNFDPGKRPRRQDLRGDLVENGMFYFARRDLVEGQGLLQGGHKCTYVEVDSKLSLEIDSSLDLSLAQQIVLHEGLSPFPPCPDKLH